MDREPTYPEDVPVGVPAKTPQAETTKAEQTEEAGGESNLTRNIVAGALGIGSAALVAALLYANRNRKSGKAVEKSAGIPPQMAEQPES